MTSDCFNPLDVTARDWPHFIRLRLGLGWSPLLLSFMFDQLPGRATSIMRQQARCVEEAYSILVTRMVRYPKRAAARDGLPVLIGAPDYPVPKHARGVLRDVLINDGQHVQALLLSPRVNRLKTSTQEFIEDNQALFARVAGLKRLHAEIVHYDADYVCEYCLKSIERGRVDPDALIILPRSISELS